MGLILLLEMLKRTEGLDTSILPFTHPEVDEIDIMTAFGHQ